MPGQLFKFTKYFKKDQIKNQPDDTTSQVQEGSTAVTYSQASPSQSPPQAPIQSGQAYSGIGKPSGSQQAYSGIGNPPTPPPPPTASDQNAAGQAGKTGQNAASSIDMGKRVGMDVLSRMTQRSNDILLKAVTKVKELKGQHIDTEHVLWALLSDSAIYQLISDCKAVPSEIQAELEKSFKKGNFSGNPQFSPRIKRVLELSLSTAKSLGYEFISPEHILLALSHEGEGLAAQVLNKFHLTQQVLNQKITGKKELEKKEDARKQTTLEQFTDDLTAKAARGELDPVVGRSWEIERVIHILSRRTKNNPVLIGDAGVGKTAIVEGMAQRIATGDVPETLLHKRILQLDLMSLIAGARHRGEFEERLKNLIKEVKSAAGSIILFIDELHNMVGAGSGGEGTMDASNILKPSLARGELQVVGTTTVTEYRKYIEKDPALERRFQPIIVAEPTKDIAVEMLLAIRDKYEAFHRVKIPDETVEEAVRLSQRYIADRFLPDKAVDLIDEAAAAVRLPAISLPEEIKSSENKLKKLEHEKGEAEKAGDTVRFESLKREIDDIGKSLTELKEQYQIKKSTTTNSVNKEVIAEIVARWTNIPVSRLTESEAVKLMELEKTIHKRLIDQEEAVSAVSEAVRRGRAGLKSNQRPIGSFIFMGPTGVGKTELAKSLAEILFGSEEMMVRLDMTEYMEKHEVAKLIGAPPGYVGYDEGGQLTEAVRRRPYSVVLLDEIEKAHPDVFNILIQLLDDGRLTDNKGHTVSFKNSIIICTSNLGSSIIQEEMLSWEQGNLPASMLKEKTKMIRTYVISPTGREIISLDGILWQKDPGQTLWKKSDLKEYFAGNQTIGVAPQEPTTEQSPQTDKTQPQNQAQASGNFPGSFDTHVIGADGSETITSDDTLWFRTSTISKEWHSSKLLENLKDHIVINAKPDKPEEQLPTAKLDSHAVNLKNEEFISLNDRFWMRPNLQVKDWTTGTLGEYFADASVEEEAVANEAKPGSKDATASLMQQRQAKKEIFPVEKWEMHLFKPSGEEIIIAGGKFWLKKDAAQKIWQTGSLEKLFTTLKIEASEELLPVKAEKETKSPKEEEQFEKLSKKLMEELRKFFRPELLNRFDEVTIFRPLGPEHMLEIVDLQMTTLIKILQEQGIGLAVSPSAKLYLAEIGFDPIFGARPLRRTIQRVIENPVSSFLIKGELSAGDTINVDYNNKELTFDIKKMVPLKTADKQADEKAVTPEEPKDNYLCQTCGHAWSVEKGLKTEICPACQATAIALVVPAKEEKAVAEVAPPPVAAVTETPSSQVPTPPPAANPPASPPVNPPPYQNPLENYFTATADSAQGQAAAPSRDPNAPPATTV